MRKKFGITGLTHYLIFRFQSSVFLMLSDSEYRRLSFYVFRRDYYVIDCIFFLNNVLVSSIATCIHNII